MIAKLVVSQVFGITAGYVTYALCDDIFGTTPAYAPLMAWLVISVVVLWALKS